MKGKNIIQSVPRNYLISFSAPTSQITNGKMALQFIDPRAAYVVIPNIQNSAIFNPEDILLEIMPHTENMIIDICLPYIQINRKKQVIKHFARYFICNKQLLGIRIKLSQHWPKSKCQKIPVPDYLKAFYQRQEIQDYPDTILIGQFPVFTNSFKIAPLFQSQISSLSQNTIKIVLSQYYSFGCQIFSIVNDLTQEKKKNLKNSIQILKNHRRQSTIAIYSGLNFIENFNDFYRTDAFAMQGNNKLQEIKITKLDQINKNSLIIDLNQLQRRKKNNIFSDNNYGKIQIQALECYDFKPKPLFKTLKKTPLKSQMMQEQIKQIITSQNSTLIYLWYLYQNVNKRNPFVLPWPYEQKQLLLIKALQDLQELINIPRFELINFLKLDHKSKIQNVKQLQEIPIIPIEKLHKLQKPIYVYFELSSKIKYKALQNDRIFKQYIPQIQKNIINCVKCVNNDQFLKRISQNNQITKQIKEEIKSQDQKFVEKFFKKKSNLCIEQFYIQAAKYYPRQKLTQNFIKYLFNILKNKIRKQFIGTSFQIFILNQQYINIEHRIKQCQKYFYSSSLPLKHQQDNIEQEQNQKQNSKQKQNFRKFLNDVKIHCQKQKKQFNVCHLCKCLFHKVNKSSYGRKCLGCNYFMCFGCYDNKTGQNAKTQDVFLNCLICNKICQCEQCNKRLNKNMTQNQAKIYFNNNNNNKLNPINIKNQQFESKIIKNQTSNATNQIKYQNIFNNNNNLKYQYESFNNNNNSQNNRIKVCSTCQIYNRNIVNIDIQCSKCQLLFCYTCQKAQNNHRNWILRGQIKCNKCYQKQIQQESLKIQLIKIKNKVTDLQYQNSHFKRQIFLKGVLNPVNQGLENNDWNKITYQQNVYAQHKVQMGSSTPIFTRGVTNISSQNNSPYRSQNNNQNQSVASFGGFKNQKKHQKTNNRNNSPNSSRSNSPPRSIPQQNIFSKKRQNPKQRKNSSNSSRSNSNRKKSLSNNSKGSGQIINKKINRSISDKKSNSSRSQKNSRRNSSAQSGQFQGSSSSQKQQKKDKQWKNVHNKNNNYDRHERNNFKDQNNYDKKNNFDNNRNGNFNRNNRNNQNGNNMNRNQNNFRGRGRGDRGNFRGNNRQDFRNNQSDRDGFRNNQDSNNRGGYRNFNQDRNNNNNWNNNRGRNDRNNFGNNNNRDRPNNNRNNQYQNNRNNQRQNDSFSKNSSFSSIQSPNDRNNNNSSYDRNNYSNPNQNNLLLPTNPQPSDKQDFDY